MKQIILEARETPRLMDIEVLFESRQNLGTLTVGDVWYDVLNSVYKFEEALIHEWTIGGAFKKAKEIFGNVTKPLMDKIEQLKGLVNYEKVKAAVLKVGGTVKDTLMEIIDAADKFRKEHPYLTTMLIGFVAAFLTVAFPGVGLIAVPVINGVFGAKNTVGLVEKMLGLVRRFLPESPITDKLTTAIDKLKDFQKSPEDRGSGNLDEKAVIVAEMILAGYIFYSGKAMTEEAIAKAVENVKTNLVKIVNNIQTGKENVEQSIQWLDKHYRIKSSGLIEKSILKFFDKYAKPQQAAPVEGVK